MHSLQIVNSGWGSSPSTIIQGKSSQSTREISAWQVLNEAVFEKWVNCTFEESFKVKGWDKDGTVRLDRKNKVFFFRVTSSRIFSYAKTCTELISTAFYSILFHGVELEDIHMYLCIQKAQRFRPMYIYHLTNYLKWLRFVLGITGCYFVLYFLNDTQIILEYAQW